MSEKYAIRLGSTLTFDTEKEKDLIDQVETLSSKHKLGELISHLLRVAFESPDRLQNLAQIQSAVSEIEKYGMTPTRAEYFAQIKKEIDEMKSKVDAMYEMNLKLLTLAQFGKQMGLEQKTENMLGAQFILEHQINDISSKLGIEDVRHIFNSNKISDAQERADETLAYILESYDNIVTELQQSIMKPKFADATHAKTAMANVKLDTVNAKPSISDTQVKQSEENSDDTEIADKSVANTDSEQDPAKLFGNDDKDEVVDFGNANLDALNSFLGG